MVKQTIISIINQSADYFHSFCEKCLLQYPKLQDDFIRCLVQPVQHIVTL